MGEAQASPRPSPETWRDQGQAHPVLWGSEEESSLAKTRVWDLSNTDIYIMVWPENIQACNIKNKDIY